MSRVPFEVVMVEASKIISGMMVKSEDKQINYWYLYLDYIEACGWTNEEFDKESMKRIDIAWNNMLHQNWN